MDKLEFIISDGGLSSGIIISVEGFVKSLLIGANSTLFEQALPLNYSQSIPTLCIEDTKNSNPKVFGLKGHFVGCIVAVGPSPLETVSNMQNADQWGSEFFQNSPNELGEAHREKDDLIQRILESNNSELETIPFGHMSSVLERVV